jgi:hypothetical protein
MKPGDCDNVSNFVLTDGAASVLESFREPQVVSDFLVAFPDRSGYPAPPVEFLKALVSKQVLLQA